MVSQPSGKSGSFAIGEQINNLVSLEIDKDRSKAATFLPAPIIHPQHSDGPSSGSSQLHELA